MRFLCFALLMNYISKSRNTNSFYFLLTDLSIELPKNELFFVSPVQEEDILHKYFNGRSVYKLKQETNIYSVCEGKVVEVDKEGKLVLVETEIQGHNMLVCYFNVAPLDLLNKEIKQGDLLGVGSDMIAVELKIDDIIANFFDYII